jgi:glucosamine kinase
MPHLVVGVDAGGTSTVAALSRDGVIVRTHEGGPANAGVRGVEAASATIADTILATLEGAFPEAIFVGAAGAGRRDVAQGIEQSLSSRFPGARIGVRDDAYIALRAAVPHGDAAVLVAGTGSVAFAVRGDQEYRSGGYGYLLGDEGSGFAIGAAALKLLLRALDERAERDAFVDELAQRLDANTIPAVLTRVYAEANPPAFIAGLAPMVLDSASRGDRSTNKIVQAAALELAQTATSLVKRAGLTETGAPLVFSGSLLASNSLLTFLLETRLNNDFPQMPILKSAAEPYAGAIAAAERL